MTTVVISSGYFDPIHPGHIDYLQSCRDIGDYHIVILNNDKQCIDKKMYFVMPAEARMIVLESIVFVDEVFISIDTEKTICNSLKSIYDHLKTPNEIEDLNIIFANGGDRTYHSHSSEEEELCLDLGIQLIYGAGSNNKDYSSTHLISNAWNKYLSGQTKNLLTLQPNDPLI